jgi:hypothetical protein
MRLLSTPLNNVICNRSVVTIAYLFGNLFFGTFTEKI